MSSSFRVTAWDPILIISQILSLQTLYYISLSVLLWITLSLSGMPMTLDAIFQTTALQTDNVFGWTLIFVLLLNAVVTIPLVVVIVQRARQVLDFALTLHGIHMVGCWLHGRVFPSTLAWWLVQATAVIIMTLGGEWACMRYEMKPILLNGSAKTTNTKNGPESGTSSLEAIEEETINEENDPSSSSSLSATSQWTHVKKAKRKASDAEAKGEQDDHDQDEGSLIAAVGKAKQVLLDKSQDWISTSKEYEIIPMNNVHNR